MKNLLLLFISCLFSLVSCNLNEKDICDELYADFSKYNQDICGLYSSSFNRIQSESSLGHYYYNKLESILKLNLLAEEINKKISAYSMKANSAYHIDTIVILFNDYKKVLLNIDPDTNWQKMFKDYLSINKELFVSHPAYVEFLLNKINVATNLAFDLMNKKSDREKYKPDRLLIYFIPDYNYFYINNGYNASPKNPLKGKFYLTNIPLYRDSISKVIINKSVFPFSNGRANFVKKTDKIGSFKIDGITKTLYKTSKDTITIEKSFTIKYKVLDK